MLYKLKRKKLLQVLGNMVEEWKSIVLESINYQPYRILKLRRGLHRNKDSWVKETLILLDQVATIQVITMAVFIYFQILKIMGLTK